MMPMFAPPSYRASQGDLTVQVSPLGLVELADEEFEVHGPRLTRYSTAWSWYLGHHYAYRREVGEPQFAFNYVKAFADYISNFCFGSGVNFLTPPATEAIVPALLKRVWEQDNDKDQLLLEFGQVGGVCGDVFAKVAYEDPYVDSVGRIHPGKCRIIPLNPSHCFPEWHPHDRHRLVRFKLKYRFWSTLQDGTRGVNTYTEIITETGIEEYVNDVLIDSRPNPLGVIPIEFCANIPVSGSPWGLSDILDIIPLNREYNEKALEISDIINYHSAPVTVIIGAKASNLEKGPRKTWTLPKDAKVQNLESLVDMSGPVSYMAILKQGMHEMTGVPQSALGQSQPISNTSGVALHIQFQPLMNRWKQKKIQYSSFFQRINTLVLLTLAQKEPWALTFDPRESGIDQGEGELIQLDPQDPNTYETSVHWPSPLPVDILVKLNEIMMKMNLGLESKKGALRDLGEEFADVKLQEIFSELISDAKDQGALEMVRSSIRMAVMLSTGVPPDDAVAPDPGGGGSVAPGRSGAGPGQPEAPPQFVVTPEVKAMAQDLVTRAFGTDLAQFRNPSNSGE